MEEDDGVILLHRVPGASVLGSAPFRKAITQLKRGQETVAAKRKREKIVLHTCI